MSKKWAWGILVTVLTASLLVSTVLPNLYFDYNFDSFFNPEDEATVYYKKQQETFGTDNDFILIGIEPDGSPFDSVFLASVSDLTDSLEKGPYVQRVISPTNITQSIQVPLTGGVLQRPYYNEGRIDSLRIATDPGMVRQLYASDLNAISLVVITDQKLSKKKCDDVAKHIFKAVEDFDQDRVHISGRAIGQAVYIQKIQEEFFLFMLISLVIVVALLYGMFRNWIAVVVPLSVVFLSILWTLSTIHFLDKGISLLMSMIPPVIFVVGMSDAVHLYARFVEEKAQGKNSEQAIKIMLRKTGLATLITSVTTSIGFATLYFTGIPSLKDFGIVTAIGVVLAFVISIMLMPALLTLSSIGKSRELLDGASWERAFTPWYDWVCANRKRIRIIAFGLTLILAFLATKIEMNNFLLEDLKKGTKLKDDFDFFDTQFSGVRPFELGIKTNIDAGMLSKDGIQTIEKLQSHLDSTYGVLAFQSIAQVAKEINRSQHGGKNAFFVLPNSSGEWSKVLKDLNRLVKSGKLNQLISDDLSYARVSGRVPDLGGKVYSKKDELFVSYLEGNADYTEYQIALTGTGNLIDRTNQNLIVNLGKGLAIAFILISVLMGALFKSLRMVVIALIPNLLPIIAVAAIMAVFGIDLKLTTGIIFTIAFGIAVDDTIHILSRFKLELRDGKSEAQALKIATTHTGKALVLTSLILFGGFLSLCFSSFQSTYYIGLLVTITLIFALFFDLSLLPALLSKSDSKNS